MFGLRSTSKKQAAKPAAAKPAAAIADRSPKNVELKVSITVQAVYRDRAEALVRAAIASCNGKIAGATFEVV